MKNSPNVAENAIELRNLGPGNMIIDSIEHVLGR